MAQTKAGAIKTRETNKRKYGDDYYKKIGAMGGSVKNPNKGFGYDNRTVIEKLLRKPKRAQLAGQVGGRISRRSK